MYVSIYSISARAAYSKHRISVGNAVEWQVICIAGYSAVTQTQITN